MPATTPVYSGLEPWRRARIISWQGPRTFLSTPSISTSMASGWVPSKTVYATPCRPRCTSARGKTPAVADEGGVAGPTWATRLPASTKTAVKVEKRVDIRLIDTSTDWTLLALEHI